ncbi:MAG: lipoprotein-releasing ABC transporter permease subunit [Pseudomonadota bacterium]
MFSSFERFVAFRYLFSARREGFVSVIAWFSFLGIALGVATLIVVMAVMNGFRQELFGSLVAMRGHVTVQSSSATPLPENKEQLALIQSVPGVRLAYPMLERQAIAMAKNNASGVMVQGLPANAITGRERIKLMPETAIEQFVGDHVFIGRRMAETLHLDVGDKLTLLSQQGTATAFGTMPRQKTFIVAGIFHVGMAQFDKNFVFMPLTTAQSFFKASDQISQIDVFSAQDNLAPNLAHVLQTALGQTVRAIDWRHSDLSIMHAVKMERNVMFLILTLIILIASFNIVSGLIMMVKDKTRDIAILRTMGATKNTILKIFFLTGASIGGVGTLLGVALGLSFALNIEGIRQFLQSMTGAELFSEEIYFLSTLPAKVEFDEVLRIVAMGIGLSFLATLYPSWRASSLDPVDGLRG